MTLLETIKLLEYLASQEPNINSIVDTGDIYDLNKDEYKQKYSAFCVQQNPHNIGEDYSTYSFTLFYVDRLTLDGSNKLDVQSTATQFFQNFLKTLRRQYYNLEATAGKATTFTERFTADCAGAYMTLDVTTPNTSICEMMHRELGAYSPAAFSSAFFTIANNYI